MWYMYKIVIPDSKYRKLENSQFLYSDWKYPVTFKHGSVLTCTLPLLGIGPCIKDMLTSLLWKPL